MSGGRQRGPDQLRGLLLTLVIFGHTYAAGISGDPSKWIIYGFHMPLFFGISGWLLTGSSLTRRSVPELLGYYWKRMLWQWLVVSLAFGYWKGALPSTARGTLDVLFFEPLFHLWFVPALVLMVVITQVVLRSGCGWRTLAAVAAGTFIVFELPIGKQYIPESLTSLDHRYSAYFIWFLLGFAVRNAGWSWLRSRAVQLGAAALAVTGLAVYASAFGGGAWTRDIGFAALNTGLIILLPLMLDALRAPLPLIGDAMARLGRGSLWIYLLHPFATEVWRPHDDGGLLGRGAGVLITVAIVGVSVALSHLLGGRRASVPAPSAPSAQHASQAAQPDPVRTADVRRLDLDDERHAPQPGTVHTGHDPVTSVRRRH
jgi:acyltransferase